MEQSDCLPCNNGTLSSSINEQFGSNTDGSSLQLFLNEYMTGHDLMWSEIATVLQMSLDPAKLVLEVIQGFLSQKWKKGEREVEVGVLRSYLLLLEQLMRTSSYIEPQVEKHAMELAIEWKEKMDINNADNSLEVVSFLQFLATYGLASSFNEDEVLKLFKMIVQHKQAPEMCQKLGFTQKVLDSLVLNLVQKKQHPEAVRFICAFKLVDKFKPVKILEEYVSDVGMNSTRILNRNKPVKDEDEAIDKEIAALKAVIECVADSNLESEFPLKGLEKHIVWLEELKVTWRNFVPPSTSIKTKLEKLSDNNKHTVISPSPKNPPKPLNKVESQQPHQSKHAVNSPSPKNPPKPSNKIESQQQPHGNKHSIISPSLKNPPKPPNKVESQQQPNGKKRSFVDTQRNRQSHWQSKQKRRQMFASDVKQTVLHGFNPVIQDVNMMSWQCGTTGPCASGSHGNFSNHQAAWQFHVPEGHFMHPPWHRWL